MLLKICGLPLFVLQIFSASDLIRLNTFQLDIAYKFHPLELLQIKD